MSTESRMRDAAAELAHRGITSKAVSDDEGVDYLIRASESKKAEAYGYAARHCATYATDRRG